MHKKGWLFFNSDSIYFTIENGKNFWRFSRMCLLSNSAVRSELGKILYYLLDKYIHNKAIWKKMSKYIVYFHRIIFYILGVNISEIQHDANTHFDTWPVHWCEIGVYLLTSFFHAENPKGKKMRSVPLIL